MFTKCFFFEIKDKVFEQKKYWLAKQIKFKHLRLVNFKLDLKFLLKCFQVIHL